MIKLEFQVHEWHTPLSEDIPCYHFTITPIHTMEKRNKWIKKKKITKQKYTFPLDTAIKILWMVILMWIRNKLQLHWLSYKALLYIIQPST